jgi:hypothetical protein
MKRILTCLTSICLFTNFAFADGSRFDAGGQRIEVPLEAVLTPYRGYDDTNNIEIVLHGSLPNTCYRIDRYKVEKVNDRVLQIHQYAVKKNDGVCGEDNALPEHLKMIVPFTTVASLGRLSAEDYTYKYVDVEKKTIERTFNVKEAHKTTVDDYPYAAVSNVFAGDVVKKGQPISVTVSGVYTNSCAYLDDDSFKVEKQNDVYVVLPVLKMKSGVVCAQSLIPFSKNLVLNPPDKNGHYLVHVRSMNGKSVNSIVQAVQ